MRREFDHKITVLGVSHVYHALGKDLVKRLKTYIKFLKTYKEPEPSIAPTENKGKGEKNEDVKDDSELLKYRRLAPLPRMADMEQVKSQLERRKSIMMNQQTLAVV